MNREIETSDRLRDLAAKINAEHDAAHAKAKQALAHAAECRRRLIEAKALVAHGQWLPWFEANTSVGARQCQKYMRLANGHPEIEANTNSKSHLTIDRALELVATPRAVPSPHATEINLCWNQAQVFVRQFARNAREGRGRGGDDRKALMIDATGCTVEFADAVEQLIESDADQCAWVDAFLCELDRAA